MTQCHSVKPASEPRLKPEIFRLKSRSCRQFSAIDYIYFESRKSGKKEMHTEHFARTIIFLNKNVSKKLKLRLKNTIIDKTLTYASETGTLTKTERKQLKIFEEKVYRRILGPVYDNEKENWRILTNKEIYASVKKTYYNRDNKVK